ncbi:MAG TPA: hypothetical protein VK869_07925 [Rubrobacteraceae bacterium]|nr:hypothetical protein [Rubrobacteraceae bacterium]
MKYRKREGAVYEKFWEMPAVLVLAALWLMGAALIGCLALALYLCASVLV